MGRFDGCVIAVDHTELVLVGVAEESASDCIVEAVYDRVPETKLENLWTEDSGIGGTSKTTPDI